MRDTAQSETRPAGNGTGSKDQLAAGSTLILQTATLVDAGDTVTRCRVCHRRLTAPRSVARELGPVCAHRLAQVIAQATGRVVAVAVIDGGLVAQLGPVAP